MCFLVFVYGQGGEKQKKYQLNFDQSRQASNKKADDCLIRVLPVDSNIAPMVGGSTSLVGYAKFGTYTEQTVEVVIHFGSGYTQKAHRFIKSSVYDYQDFIDVPFQVWSKDGAVQYHVAFYDGEDNGQWDVGAGSNREFTFIAFEQYTETPSSAIISRGGVTGITTLFSADFMYAFHLTSPTAVNAENMPSAKLSLLYDNRPKLELGYEYLETFPQGMNLYQTIGNDFNSSAILAYGCEFPTFELLQAPSGMTLGGSVGSQYIFWDTTSDATLGSHEIKLEASNSHGKDTLTVSFGVQKAHNNNNIALIIGENGHFSPTIGSFFYSETTTRALLFEGSLVIAASDEQYSGKLFGYTEFTNTTAVHEVQSTYGGFDYGLSTTFNDFDNENGLDVNVVLNSSSKSTAPDNDYILLDYLVINEGENTITDAYVGLTMDWDILSYNTNTTYFDSLSQMAIVYDNSNENSPYVGVKVLSNSTSGFRFFTNNGEYDSLYTVAMKRIGEGATNTDIKHQVSTGPFTMSKDSSTHIVFALVAGTSLEDLKLNAEAAQTVYNSKQESTDDETIAQLLPELDSEDLAAFLSSDKVTYNEDSRIIGLDLSQFSFDSIPNSIGNLTYLESLTYYGTDDSGKAKQALENPYTVSENKPPILHRNEPQNYGQKINSKKSSSQLTYIDDALFALPFLKKVQIPNNIIPYESFEKLFTIPSIEFIDVTNNQLTGDFPETFAQATKLIELHAGDNSLTGEIPSRFSTHPDLRVFNLYYSRVTGSWPLENWDREWQSVAIHGGADLDIYLPETSTQWQKLSNMWQFNFIGTIHGAVTIDLVYLIRVEYLIVENKSTDTSTGLTGTFPSSFATYTNIRELFISGHHELTGELPADIGDLVNVERLGIYNNTKMSGSIPSSIGRLTKLRALYLYNQNLTGSIPTSIGDLIMLNRLDLDQNNLTGTLPSEIGHLISLKILWLAANQLSGSIPNAIGDLTHLEQLYLYQNKFSGEIPSSVEQLSFMTTFRLDHNELTGSIPLSIGSLSSLNYINVSYNHLSGSVPEGIYTLPYLNYLGLTSNELDIDVPAAISSSTSLKYLYVSNNKSSSVNSAAYSLPLIGYSETNSTYPADVEQIGSSLERLHINGFSIDSIPQSLVEALPNLKTLGISAKKLSSNVNTLVNMENLYLHDKQGEVLSPHVNSLIHLQRIEAIGGKLATIPDNYLSLPHFEFHVDSNRIVVSSLSEAMQLRFAELEGWTILGQTPPAIGSDPVVTNLEPTSATVSLVVSQQETATLHYGLTTSYGSKAVVTGYPTIVFNLTDLLEQSTYHYKIVLNEGQANATESADFTFTTPRSDNTPPTFTSSVQFSTEASLSHFLTLYITANETLIAKPAVKINTENIAANNVTLFNEAEHIYRVTYTASTSGEKVFEFSGTDLNGNVGSGNKTLVLGSLTPNASKLVISPQIQLENAVRFSAESAVLVEKDAKADQTNVEFIQKTDALRIKRSGATHKLRLSVDLTDLKAADKLVNHAFYTFSGEEWTYLGGKLNGNRLEYEFEQAALPIAVFWNKNQQLIPTEFLLEQNYPNPFNPTTTIRFAVPQAGHVGIRIFNSLGQLVAVLENKQFDAGYHTTVWNGLNSLGQKVPSGVYFYQIITPNSVQTKKMVLVK
jgi:Leucine-rich repeat (LRR) protein